MNRPYKDCEWPDLLKGRDSFLLLADLGFINGYDCPELKSINDEIDYRYNRQSTAVNLE